MNIRFHLFALVPRLIGFSAVTTPVRKGVGKVVVIVVVGLEGQKALFKSSKCQRAN